MSPLKGGVQVPRGRRSSTGLQLSPGQAKYVLGRLVSDRRISAAEVNRCIGEMHREIATLEKQLEELREASGGARRASFPAPWAAAPRAAAPRPAAAPRAAAAPKARRRRRSPITAEQLASRQLQGRYLGLIRQIPANKRGQYQKTAKDKGREAAIKEMKATLRK